MRFDALFVATVVASFLGAPGCVIVTAPPPSAAKRPAETHNSRASASSLPAAQGAQHSVNAPNGGEAPAWLASPDAVFPAHRYLNGVGSGAIPEMADRAAKANLAAIFEARIQAVLTSYESESIVFGQVITRQQTQQLIRATTNQELEGVWVAERWFDGKNYFAVALLDRQQAMSAYSAEAAQLDRFFLEAREILEGKRPLIVRKTRLKLAKETTEQLPSSVTAPSAPQTSSPQTGALTPEIVRPPQVPPTAYGEVVEHAEAAFEELDRSTAPEVSASVSQSPQANASASPSAPVVPTPPQISEVAADTSPNVPQDIAVAAEVVAPEMSDVYMAQSSRLQKARLAKKIVHSADKRRELAADFHLVSPTQSSLPPPSYLPQLEAWAEAALRDLKVAVDVDASGNGAQSAPSSFKMAVGKALASQEMEVAPPDGEADVTVEIQYTALPIENVGGWHWARGSIQLNVIDEHSGATIYSIEKSDKKASQIAQEAQVRLIQHMANNIVHSLIIEFIEQL